MTIGCSCATFAPSRLQFERIAYGCFLEAQTKLLETRRIEQLSLPLPDTAAYEENCEMNEGATLFPSAITNVAIEVQERIEVIQQVIAVRGTERYAKVQRQAAQKLGLSVRSLGRLMSAWQQHGIAGLTRQSRSDQGTSKPLKISLSTHFKQLSSVI